MSEEVKRYDISGVEKNLESGEWVQYEHYEKLLAKYNGVFEWIGGSEDFDSAEDAKKEFESLYEQSFR